MRPLRGARLVLVTAWVVNKGVILNLDTVLEVERRKAAQWHFEAKKLDFLGMKMTLSVRILT